MKNQVLTYGFFAIMVVSNLSCSHNRKTDKNKESILGDSLYLKNVPAQPGEDTWKFIDDLKSSMWTKHAWRKAQPGPQEVDLSQGVKFQKGFSDTKGRLETAYEDLRSFLAAGDVSCDNGKYIIETIEDKELKEESFRLDIKSGGCQIIAGDADGVRRGIFYLEDEMLRQRGPFLTPGKIEKHPILERRISRCFFGPIKRFPKMRDELMDDVNYYPDQYLNRMAHEGVNGLWLTVEFRDLVATSFTPEAGKDAAKRLAKLQRTVEACLRYGIRIYIFCIEPMAWDTDSPVLKKYPELAGTSAGEGHSYFCPSSETARKYLYESVNTIFKAVPELGGLINISHGEVSTTCLSALSNLSQYHKGMIDCPRCSQKEPWEILSASLSAMEQGMHDASPNAELISWLYMPDPFTFNTGDPYALGDWVYELPAHTPKGVILQFNFESGVTRTVFGKFLVGGDYWISIPGPSARFSRLTEIAGKNGTEVSAKIQTGCSHEVASVPYVPVPALLYRKFSAMRKLGVTHTMLCWYFGNYPGLMNKAAGELSFEPFPKDEDTFLHQLATFYWKKEDESKVVESWKYFSEGYENYPLINRFQWYGPMHDGTVWPLLLKPMDAPLSPTWEIGSSITRKPWPPSGDRIGECIGNVLTLKETVELCRRMSTTWDKGIAILNELEPKYSHEPERILDIGVAKALGIQFRSGYNILRFYLLREEMFRLEGMKRLDILKQLGDIIREEIDNDNQLLVLCEKDSRLGFHSEAEGYKYFPEKIRWRMNQLREVLANDIPELKKLISDNKLLFPEYTGKEPAGNVAYAIPTSGLWSGPGFDTPQGLKWQPCRYGSDKSAIRWAATYDSSALYIIVSDSANSIQSKLVPTISGITVKIEPRRLWFCSRFEFNTGDIYGKDENIRIVNESGKRKVIMRIPFKHLWWSDEGLHPFRVDVQVQKSDGGTSSWCPDNPLNYRLTFGKDNPADLGWLMFYRDTPCKSDSLYLKNMPSQPGEDTWKFIEDLKSPMWTKHAWGKALPGIQQADLSRGVKFQLGFPDPKVRLKTAYEDLRAFLAAGNVLSDDGKYLIETVEDKEIKGESFRLDIKPGGCQIIAGDADGVRRGIFYLEDEMLRQQGPFLTLGKVEKHPIIERRISRCFFGPIKRFPKMRDELMDSVNYYPDQYLNRLAHEGVNGLWLTVEFRDLVATSFTPEAGKDAKKRLAKLQRTVDQCLRYGIRTYIFCIEPRVWDAENPVLKNYPELAGGSAGEGHYYFCPSTESGRKYLYESVNTIFKAVPELGGMINVSLGERATICLAEDGQVNCPRCSQKKPWEILNASLSAMEKGMHDAAPDAELISWLYLPQPQRFDTGDSYDLGDWVYELSAHIPKGVILQFNFESGVSRTEFGKLLVGGDYWISTPGPSSRFNRIAEIAKAHGTKVSAKIQTGNSHEVATIPFVPVPSLLYQKFSAMKRLGVSHTMLCWYFGSYPGLMNKAAGELSFEPFPKDESTFLHQLANIYWRKEDVSKVVEAWKDFSEGYENYPLTNLFQYYGPMADGPVWPLLLKPMDTPLSPTWQIGSSRTRKPWPPSGDRVGECIGDVLTLKETVELTRRMSTAWDRGVKILSEMEHRYRNEPERILDIGVARALGIQFRSGYNILNFYLLREEMLRMEGKERLTILKKLVRIIHAEIDLDKQLIELCDKDSRLGFHSEAEGYKYFPEKIQWRMQQLQNLLDIDVPELKKQILNNELLYPEYTGKKPIEPVAYAVQSDGSLWSGSGLKLTKKIVWQSCDIGAGISAVRWMTSYDAEALYIMVQDSTAADQSSPMSTISSVEVLVEPQRLFPTKHFVFHPQAEKLAADVRVLKESGICHVVARIPLERIGLGIKNLHPIRIDVQIRKNNGELSSWRPNNPVTERLILGTDNPADLGWLLFQK